jgi:hypothetical protein
MECWDTGIMESWEEPGRMERMKILEYWKSGAQEASDERILK